MAEQAPKKTRERSPNYPGIDLGEAIGRAEALRKKEGGRHFFPVKAAFEHWRYRPMSGGGMMRLAALKHFGLLIEQGTGEQRQVRLSDLALRILLDDIADSPDRLKALQEAALKPTVHAELWEEFGDSLPSDATLRVKLRSERHFTDRAVDQFIQQFRKTIEFAKLAETATIPGHEEEKPPLERAEKVTSMPGTRAIEIPLPGPIWATLHAPFPLSETTLQTIIEMLTAMKGILFRPGDGTARPEDDTANPEEAKV